MDADEPPAWFADVAGWLVTMAEGRFGLCRMFLWLRTASGAEDASVVMPHPEYTEVERAVSRGDDEREFFTVLWQRGLLPSERPAGSTPAPVVDGRQRR